MDAKESGFAELRLTEALFEGGRGQITQPGLEALTIIIPNPTSTLSEHLSLFVELLFTIGGIGSGLTFSVTDFHLAEDLRQRRIPPG